MTTMHPARSAAAPTSFADPIDMQNRLFAELSRMFGQEVPMYDRSLAVNAECNRAVCDLLAKVHTGFRMSDEQLNKTSSERHGAIRIGRPDEYRWVARFFSCFGMHPHNFYDMTAVGSKSQPIIATAFRSVMNPEHRVFTSLLMTDYFDGATKDRIEQLLAPRAVFSDNAKKLIEKAERQAGLDWADADALIKEGTDRIFRWTGRARDFKLYKDLCDAGFKIAADIACFQSHHLNHLTPNTFCMDLFTAAMKFCMGELPEDRFRARAGEVLSRLIAAGDADFMRLHFKHLSRGEIDAFAKGSATRADAQALADRLTDRLKTPPFALHQLKHNGFKDFTEGPSEDTPVLLRQDAYKALTEPVKFENPDGTAVDAVHTARFGEIEERFYATTPAGRELYDRCLAEADAAREKDPGLPKRDMAAYEALYAKPFSPFPKSVPELIGRGIVRAYFSPTPAGLAAAGTVASADLHDLVARGFVRAEGLRYEDFLPVSAAGIFASNLNQYGTASTAATRPTYTQAQLEAIIGTTIISADAVYAAVEARSILDTYAALGLTAKLPPAERARLQAAADAYPVDRAAGRSPIPAGV
jgi:uncharacterized glyoxalase superfamily metalloenzyme YdcJ